MRKKLVLSCLILCIFTAIGAAYPAYGEDISSRFGVGLNWPGLSVKYGLSPAFAIEARYQNESDINVFGPRIYYVLKGLDKLNLFAGAEADYLTFTGDVSKGTGSAGEIFVGGEYFINRNLSFQLDMGPAYISLNDANTSESVNGIETIVNLGVNYYFGK